QKGERIPPRRERRGFQCSHRMKKESVDFLVVGGGIAGYQAVLSLLPHGSVLLVSRGPLSSGSSYYA
ncbi:MAG: hypothetical protein ACYCVG_10825, partial [Leptospirillum sp.]